MKLFSVLFCLFAFAAVLFAAPVDESSWKLAAQGDDLALSLTLPDNAHAYEASTGPVLPDGVAPVSAPAPKQEKDAVTGELDSFFVGPGVITWVLPQTAAVNGKLKVKWQVCVGEMCYMPGSAELAVPGADSNNDDKGEVNGASATETKEDAAVELLPFRLERSADGYLPAEKFLGFLTGDESKYSAFTFAGKGFLMMLLLAILGGIALNLTPCVLPLLPSTSP